MVVIQAAGKGNRMGLPEGISKCSITIDPISGASSVVLLIEQMRRVCGEKEFIIVLGYGADSVVKSIKESLSYKDINIKYMYNPRYEDGCYFTVECAYPSLLSGESPVYFIEGDSIYTDSVVREIHKDQRSCSAVRCYDYLTTRSVAVLQSSTFSPVSLYVYDPTHEIEMSQFHKLGVNVYDSMQLWKITDKVLLKESFEELKDQSDRIPNEATNLLIFNQYISHGGKIIPRLVSDPDGWINLNTKEDVERARNYRRSMYPCESV